MSDQYFSTIVKWGKSLVGIKLIKRDNLSYFVMFQEICTFVHTENVLSKINVNYPLFCLLFDYAYLIRLCDVTKPTKWPLLLESICKYSNAHNFHIFSSDLYETGIKIHGL